jgi:hypothetical protein
VKYTQRADGSQAIADDMPPATRAFLFLVEHANARRDAGLTLPCLCAECERHRGSIRCSRGPGNVLVIEAGP